MAKSTAVVVRLMLRRSIGFVVTILDAILDEAAAHLEASLLTAPAQHSLPHQPTSGQPFVIQQQFSVHAYVFHVIFTILGALVGRHWPRAQPTVCHLNLRPPQP